MVIEQKTVIGGEIVGIGKIRADGSEDFKWLKDPIHNQITTKGIDNLLMWNGSSDLPSSNIDKEISSLYLPCGNIPTNYLSRTSTRDTSVTRTGVLYYSAYGDGTGNIDPDTAIELINRISDITSTFREGYYFNGSNCVSVEGNHQLQFRVTHTYPVVSEHQNVNEIGFYHKVEPNGEYTLFSRVQLDNTYELNPGESLIITYQLNVKYPNYPKHIDNFFGLKDVDGNTLQANETTCIKVNDNFDWTFSLYRNTYYRTGEYNARNSPVLPMVLPYYPLGMPRYGLYETYDMAMYGGDDGFIQYGWRPVWGLKNETQLRCIMIKNDVNNLDMIKIKGPVFSNINYQESVITTQILPYTTGSKYRDYTLVLPTSYPYLNSGEEYIDFNILIFNGVAYRFGYDDNGTWVPQKLRKYGDQIYKLTYRMSYATEE